MSGPILRALAGGLLWMLQALPAGAQGPAVVLVVGDSLSAGYGVPQDAGWVELLAQRLASQGRAVRVVNASISGDTSRGGRARLPAALAEHRPAVVVVELGGNDGLRGIPPAETEDNLDAMVAAGLEAGARVLLVGIRLPPNYGPAYTERFEATFREVARRRAVPLVPFLLEGVATRRDLMQEDGIHPRAEAQPRLLENVWPHLEPLLPRPEEVAS